MIFVPFLAQSSPNPWNFLSNESKRHVFCYVNEVGLEPTPTPMKDGGWLPGEPTIWSECWNSWSYSNLQGRERTRRLNRSPMANDLVKSWLCDEASIKTQKDRVGEVPCWWIHEGAGRMAPSASMDAPRPFLPTLPYAPLPSGCSSVAFLIPFNKLINVSVVQSSVRHSNKLIKPKEGVFGTSNL